MIESSEIMRTKWESLKNSYENYQKKAEKLTGIKSRKCPTYHQWCWAENLQFLESCGMWRKPSKLKTSNTSLHISSVDPDLYSPALELVSSTIIPKSSEVLKDNTEPEPRSPVCIQTTSGVWSTRLSAPSCKRRWKRNYSTSAEYGDNGGIHRRVRRGKSSGPIDFLFKSYAETFRTFSARKQVLLKLKLAKLFADAEMEEVEDGLLKFSSASMEDEHHYILGLDVDAMK